MGFVLLGKDVSWGSEKLGLDSASADAPIDKPTMQGWRRHTDCAQEFVLLRER